MSTVSYLRRELHLSAGIIGMKIHLWDTIYSGNEVSPLERVERIILTIQISTPTF